jgi:hypothetical protein
MELTIKHLAPYLPYRLELKYNDALSGKRKALLSGITIREIETTYKRKIKGCSGDLISWNGNNNVKYLKVKPILRPLSMLDKEIEVNGEKFIPIYKFWQLAGYELGRGQYIESYPNYIKTSHLGIAIEFKINISDILSSNYNVVEKLCEWHFDIFGLIDAGLAIEMEDSHGR